MNKKTNQKEEIYQRVIAFLNRQQVDFIDKIGKDALFSKGTKLSRSKIISMLVDLMIELGIDGEGISSLEELKQRIKEKIHLVEAKPLQELQPQGASPLKIGEHSKERRRYRRFNVNLEVEYRLLESLQPYQTTSTEDTCEEGIKINLPEYIEPDTRLELIIRIPQEPEPIMVIGRVVWVKKNSLDNSFTTGIHLVHIKEEDKQRFYQNAFL